MITSHSCSFELWENSFLFLSGAAVLAKSPPLHEVLKKGIKRSSKVMMTEQIVGLGSCFALIFRLLQSQFKWKSEHVATAVCVERKLHAPADGVFRSGVNLYHCVCREHCGDAMALAREQPWNCISVCWCCLMLPSCLGSGILQAGRFFQAQVGV